MKINISKLTNRKSTFRANVPCSTTLNFGQSSPVFCKELIPNATLSGKVNNFVRTSVLSLPTFGDYKLLTHVCFVPYGDIYKPFDSLLANTRYGAGVSLYKPTHVPRIQATKLIPFILNYKIEDINLCYCIKVVDNVPQILSASEQSELSSTYGKARFDTPQPIADFETAITLSNGTKVYLQYTEQGKFIMRILQGLGYGFDDAYYSALPFVSYVKATFDIFSICQDDSENTPFESTYLYRLIMNKFITSNGYILDETDFDYLVDMLLHNTYYINDDYISLHSLYPAITGEESINLPTSNTASINQSSKTGTYVVSEEQSTFTDSQTVTSDRLKAIFRIGNLIKQNTQIAGRLRAFMRSRFGSAPSDNHDTIVVKSMLTDIEISDIFSTATTSGENSSILGEYGGRAIGKGNDTFSFTADKFGMLFIIQTIIQRRNYFQSVNPDITHVTKNDFFTPTFDSLGFSLSSKSQYFTTYDRVPPSDSKNSFGLKPRYLEYKFFKPNVIGDFHRKSTKDTLISFIGSAYQSFNDKIPVCSKELNYPSFRPSLYNYNHIFYEHEPNVGSQSVWTSQEVFPAIADPFIIHNLFELTMNASMISVSDSFETNEDGHDPVSVEKS